MATFCSLHWSAFEGESASEVRINTPLHCCLIHALSLVPDKYMYLVLVLSIKRKREREREREAICKG